MSESSIAVTIQVLDKEYMVSCPPEEKDALLASARALDARMRQVREAGKVLGTERVAVMTALNLIHESKLREQEHSRLLAGIDREMERLSAKIVTAVSRRAGDREID
ncbi:MAG: cell division protein ZapA [Gammaproteobacteria bacterium]|nr:cell division protein ZapA [Gammaproteobacteria bacterium]